MSERHEQMDTREDCYWLGVSDTLQFLLKKGFITPLESSTLYTEMESFADELAIAQEQEDV